MMVGYVLGGIALVGVAYLMGRRRGWRRSMYRGYSFGPRSWLRGVFYRLQTTPGQEKEIVAAVEDLVENWKKMRGEVKTWKDEVSASLKGDQLDEARLQQLFERQRGEVEPLQAAFSRTLSRIHEALDGEQRKQFAELVAAGPRAYTHFGGYYGHRC